MPALVSFPAYDSSRGLGATLPAVRGWAGSTQDARSRSEYEGREMPEVNFATFLQDRLQFAQGTRQVQESIYENAEETENVRRGQV